MPSKSYESPVLNNSMNSIEDTKVEKTIGVVIDCLRLNIRKEPSMNAEIITVANALDELEIDLDNSVDGWLAVCTAFGMEGFCMRKFVTTRR